MKIQWFCENIFANSGYSDEARVMIRGLKNQGVEVKVVGKNKRPGPSEFDFQNDSDPNIPIVFHSFRHGSYQQNPEQYSITRTMLEVSRIPLSWVYRFNRLNEIWIPNHFCFDLFRKSGVSPEKMFVISSPVDLKIPDPDSLYRLETNKKFVLLSLFNYNARYRKGLDVLLKAYIETFKSNDDICLVLKTNTTLTTIKNEFNLPEEIPEVRVLNEVLTEKELYSLYRRADCFILPSRGEGIGRPLLAVMQVGTPIITTGWGGQCEFLNSQNSYLIKFKLVDIESDHYLRYPGFFGSQWAEPDIEDLKANLLTLYQRYADALIKASRARVDAVKWNVEKTSQSIMDRLNHRLPSFFKLAEKPNLFERLFPLYYPRLQHSDDVFTLSQQDFNKKIKSVAVYGASAVRGRVVDFLHRIMRIPDIVLIESGVQQAKYRHFTRVELSRFSKRKTPVDIIVIAVKLKDLRTHFFRLLNQIDSIPVYYFD